ncbi:N-acetylmuramoyl-L-alanine amidase [Lysobacter sp. TAF61]|uniref:N-acetylmuramoyl-L-alanine amidase n=1 Tax=Lysobacter sp. TAF61 TaxID=3233072 RepID=UPI003F9B0F1E
MSVIVIDPGHGGTQVIGGSSPNNATGPQGTKEKNLTLDVARRIVPLLTAKGHTAVLTRDSDVNLGLTARAHVARDRKAAAFIAIHFNGFNGRAQGTETFVHARSGAASTALAKQVQQFLLAVTQHADRGLKRAQFGALSPASHHATTAACLVEVSFMDVAQEEQRLLQEPYRQGIAEALAAAAQAFVESASFGLETSADEAEFPEPEDGFELIVR